jgi:DNA invertase Pin-like site-specific DNA recombinase
MNAIIYTGVRIDQQNHETRINELKEVARHKGWKIVAVISETVFNPDDTSEDKEYYQVHDPVFSYVYEQGAKIVLVHEVSCLGKNVADILKFVETLHEYKAALYIQQFDMLSFENGKENSTFMLSLQMMASAVEIDANSRKERQKEGIERARLQGKYHGRKNGAKASREKVMEKYKDIISIINDPDLSLRQIAVQTNHSINTIRKIKKMFL